MTESHEKKKFLNVKQQIEYLKTNKKIIVDPSDDHLFTCRNYIELINPYKELICYGKDENQQHIYVNETSFQSIKELVKIDDQISKRLFSLVFIFEKKFRDAISILISQKYRDSAFGDQFGICYLEDIENILKDNAENSVLAPNINKQISQDRYELDIQQRIENKKDLLKKIRLIVTPQEDCKSKSNQLIARAIKSQEIAPFWLIASVLSLGELHMLWSMQDMQTQQQIYRWMLELPEETNVSRKNYINFPKMQKISVSLEIQ